MEGWESCSYSRTLRYKNIIRGKSDHHLKILQYILEHEKKLPTLECYVYGDSGSSVHIPLAMILECMPNVKEIACQMADSFSDGNGLHIIIPHVSHETLDVLRDLVSYGYSERQVKSDVHDEISCLLPQFKLIQVDVVSSMKPSNEKRPKFQNLLGATTFKAKSSPAGDLLPIYTDISFVQPNHCSKDCLNKCFQVVPSWPSQEILQVQNMFKSDQLHTSKQLMLQHLICQENIVGHRINSYRIRSHEFCLEYLSHLTGFSVYILKKVMEEYCMGVRIYCHGNKGLMKAKSSALITAICWLKSFSEAYGQYSPEDNVTILSYWLTKQVLFEIYKEEVAEPHISQSSFYEMFKSKFGPNREDKSLPWITISKYSSHSVCRICVALNTNQRQCKTEGELKIALAMRNNHKMDFGQARRKVEEIKQSALGFPHDHLFIQIDSMDNNKSYLPRYLERSKDLVSKECLPTKITGCIIYSRLYEKNRKILFYINHDVFENASNMIITLVYFLLLEFVQDHGFLPR